MVGQSLPCCCTTLSISRRLPTAIVFSPHLAQCDQTFANNSALAALKDDPDAQIRLIIDSLLHKFCSRYRALLMQAATAEAGIFPTRQEGFVPPLNYLRVVLELRDDVGIPDASMQPESVFKAVAVCGQRFDRYDTPEQLHQLYRRIEQDAREIPEAASFTVVVVSCRGMMRMPSFILGEHVKGDTPMPQDWTSLLAHALANGPNSVRLASYEYD